MKRIKTAREDFTLPEVPEHLIVNFNEVVKYINENRLPLHEVITVIYGMIEKYNKEYVSTFAVCSKGCSHCCHQNVDLTTLEAEYIGFFTGIPVDKGESRIRKENQPCVFLDQSKGICKIYPFRPFKCRTLHAIEDPKLCESDEDQLVYGHAPSGFNSIYYSNFYDYIVFENGSLPARYLSDFFPKAYY